MPHTLETERLILRPFTLDDADEAYDVFESHPDVWRFDPGYARTREQRAALITRYAANNQGDGVGTLAVTLKESGLLIGYVGLQYYALPGEPFATPEVELYYKFGRAWQRRGYATEACHALLRFAFAEMRLKRIVTVTQPNNTHSIQLLKRLGMRIEDGPPAWKDCALGILENTQASF